MVYDKSNYNSSNAVKTLHSVLNCKDIAQCVLCCRDVEILHRGLNVGYRFERL